MKKNLIEKCEKLVAKAALATGKVSVSSACFFCFHQPRVPQSMQKFQKQGNESDNA